jgi:DNA-binding beta-propeller fold protein YncE
MNASSVFTSRVQQFCPPVKCAAKPLLAGFFALACLFGANISVHGDNIYVATWNNTIERLDSSGNRFIFATLGLNGFSGMAIDSSGYLYVAGGNTIWKFDSNGNGSVFASSGLSNPSGLAFDGAGNLFVANFNNNTIVKFDSSGTGSVFASSGLNLPVGLALDNQDNLYVSSLGDSTIVKFDSNGIGSVFASGLYSPAGLAFDRSGYLYVAVIDRGIAKCDTNGDWSIFANYRSGDLDPFGLAFGSDGYLYVANGGYGTIWKFDPDGNGSILASGLSFPFSIAIQVPEPTTWCMVVLGVAVLLCIRRRNSQVQFCENHSK